LSQVDNLYSELSKSRAQFNTLLAAYWKQGLRPTIVNLGTFTDGTRYAVTDQYRDTKFYLVTDPLGLTQTFGFDQTLSTFTTGSHTTTTRHIVAEVVPGATALQIGGSVKILDSTGAFFLAIDSSGRITATANAGTGTFTVGGSTGVLQQDAIGGGLVVAPEPIIDGQGRLTSSFAAHITTNATTNVVASTAYLASLVITTDATGTGSTITIQDKSATPKKLVNGLGTTALTTTPNVLSFADQAVLMTGGIDIVTAGAVAATVDVWATYLT
jgi:hypothetical protein